MMAKSNLVLICFLLGATSTLARFLTIGVSSHYSYPRSNKHYVTKAPKPMEYGREIRHGPYAKGGYSVVQPFSTSQVYYEFNGAPSVAQPAPVVAQVPIPVMAAGPIPFGVAGPIPFAATSPAFLG